MISKNTIRKILREETEYVKDVRVKISDILKTNRDGQSLDDAIVNVQDGLKSYSEGLPFLLKIGDKYEVLDGFHRIAQKILDGKKYIISDVMIKESNMNLQENIKRILRENMNVRLYLLRRYDYDELNNILQNSLQIQSRNLKHYKDKTFNNFNNAVVRSITERIGEELTDGWVEELPIPENEIYDFVESFFKDEIIKKYDDLGLNNMNLEESIIRILREETKIPASLRRRFDFSVMDRVFEESLDIMSTRYVKHADKWNAMTAKKFKVAVVSDMMQYFQNIMYTQYMNEKIFEEMWGFLMDYYSPQMEEEYYKISGESKQEQNESEITEKCWKGYTQKGMKTMFGKRYPNCVKKTKK